MTVFRNCRRAVSLGFASFVEPAQPGGGFGQPSWHLKNWTGQLHTYVMSNTILKPCKSASINCILKNRDISVQNDHHQRNGHLFNPVLTQNRSLKLSSFIPSREKTTDEKPGEEEEESNMTIFQRFKSSYKKHGKTLLAVHVATSACWFGGFYYVARSGLDVVSWMEYYEFPPKMIGPFKHAGLGDLAVMYLLYKLATPIRYTVTLGGTNIAIRYLKSTGYIEPVAPGDSLRDLMKDSSDKLKEKRSEFVEQSKEKIKSIRDKDKSDTQS